MGLASVLVVEDDTFSATTLEAALLLAGFDVLATANNARQALNALNNSKIDVAVLDIDLGPGPTGIDVAHALREQNPTIGLVFLTSFTDPRLSRSGTLALPKGARYSAKQELKDLRALGAQILQAKFHPLSTDPNGATQHALNSHQIEILKLVAAGATNTEIARQTRSSEKAVEHTIARIAKSLGLERSPEHNARVQLVRAFADLTGKSLPTS